MPAPRIDILMYHSISDASGATSISADIFADQMAAIAEAGVKVITLDDLVSGLDGGFDLPSRSVIITFDDGFMDFAKTAWPVLDHHGFRSIVYLPTAQVGRDENWDQPVQSPRPLMHWADIRHLAASGVVFGSHTVSHPNLNTLTNAELECELDRSRQEIEHHLGEQVHHFAPPYGLANDMVRAQISARYHSSVGTRLGTASSTSCRFDLPRLEMFYFRDIDRWRDHLAGRGDAYLLGRKLLREAGKLVSAVSG